MVRLLDSQDMDSNVKLEKMSEIATQVLAMCQRQGHIHESLATYRIESLMENNEEDHEVLGLLLILGQIS